MASVQHAQAYRKLVKRVAYVLQQKMPEYIDEQDAIANEGTGGQVPYVDDERYFTTPPPAKFFGVMDLFCVIMKGGESVPYEGAQRSGDQNERSGLWVQPIVITVMYSKPLGYEPLNTTGHDQVEDEFLEWCAEVYKGALIRCMDRHLVDGEIVHQVDVASGFSDLYDIDENLTYGRARIEIDVKQLIVSDNAQFDVPNP